MITSDRVSAPIKKIITDRDFTFSLTSQQAPIG